jgi:hypothetical protein
MYLFLYFLQDIILHFLIERFLGQISILPGKLSRRRDSAAEAELSIGCGFILRRGWFVKLFSARGSFGADV